MASPSLDSAIPLLDYFQRYSIRRRGKCAYQTKVADNANEAHEKHQAGVGKAGRDGGKGQKSAAEQNSGKRRVKQGRHRQIGAMQKPGRDLIERIGESGQGRNSMESEKSMPVRPMITQTPISPAKTLAQRLGSLFHGE
jgi:hypothetical protein